MSDIDALIPARDEALGVTKDAMVSGMSHPGQSLNGSTVTSQDDSERMFPSPSVAVSLTVLVILSVRDSMTDGSSSTLKDGFVFRSMLSNGPIMSAPHSTSLKNVGSDVSLKFTFSRASPSLVTVAPRTTSILFWYIT